MMKEILINIAGAIIVFAVAIGIVIFVSVILYPLIDHWQKGFEAYLNTK